MTRGYNETQWKRLIMQSTLGDATPGGLAALTDDDLGAHLLCAAAGFIWKAVPPERPLSSFSLDDAIHALRRPAMEAGGLSFEYQPSPGRLWRCSCGPEGAPGPAHRGFRSSLAALGGVVSDDGLLEAGAAPPVAGVSRWRAPDWLRGKRKAALYRSTRAAAALLPVSPLEGPGAAGRFARPFVEEGSLFAAAALFVAVRLCDEKQVYGVMVLGAPERSRKRWIMRLQSDTSGADCNSALKETFRAAWVKAVEQNKSKEG